MTNPVPRQFTPTRGWCGRLGFLAQRRGSPRHDAVTFDLRMEWVAVSVDGEVLAVLDRDCFRLWLSRPSTPFVTDSVAIAHAGGLLTVYDDAQVDWFVEVPGDIAEALRTHV